MKNLSRDNIIAILVLIAVFIGIRIYQNTVDTVNIQLSLNGNTTVGKIIKRDLPGARTISSIGYKFVYYVGGVKIENWISADKRFPVGSFFEVTYLPDAPRKSRLEFEIPVPPDSVCTYFEIDCPFVTR
jgi:hypothetical protein